MDKGTQKTANPGGRIQKRAAPQFIREPDFVIRDAPVKANVGQRIFAMAHDAEVAMTGAGRDDR